MIKQVINFTRGAGGCMCRVYFNCLINVSSELYAHSSQTKTICIHDRTDDAVKFVINYIPNSPSRFSFYRFCFVDDRLPQMLIKLKKILKLF